MRMLPASCCLSISLPSMTCRWVGSPPCFACIRLLLIPLFQRAIVVHALLLSILCSEQEHHAQVVLQRRLSMAREAEQRLLLVSATLPRSRIKSQSIQRRSIYNAVAAAASAKPRTAAGRSGAVRSEGPLAYNEGLPAEALKAALAAAVAARASAPDLASVREAAVCRRRSLQRKLTTLSTVMLRA